MSLDNVYPNRGLGWVPDTPDIRDQTYSVTGPVLQELPQSVDLTPKLPKVYDQGPLGSCTSFAIGSLTEYLQMKQSIKSFTPSHLFIYYNERKRINTINEDSGAVIRDGFKSINKEGVCPETMWPYIVQKFTQKPSSNCYSEGKRNQVLKYMRVQRDLDQMKGVLAEGYPFVIGFSVYSSFMAKETAISGVGNLPKPGEKLMGGHAVLCVGYSDNDQRFLFRNSWSDKWGKRGNFTLPYEYLLEQNLSDDFWVGKIIEG